MYNSIGGFLPTDDHLQGLKEGNPGVIDEIAAGLVPYAKQCVRWYLSGKPHFGYLREDLHGVAYIVLIECLNKMVGRTIKTTSLLNYIQTSIKNRCLETCLKDPAFHASYSQARRGTQFNRVRIQEGHLKEEPHNELIFDDFVETVLTPEHQEVVRGLIQGLTHKQIAEQMETSVEWVDAIREHVKEKLLDEGFEKDF